MLVALALVACTADAAEQFEYLPDEQEVVWKPQMVPAAIDSALYTINSDDLKTLLDDILLFDDIEQFEALPYIVGFDKDANIGSAGDLAYVMGLDPNSQITSFSLLNTGKIFQEPEAEEVVGLEVNVIGSAQLVSSGTPQVIKINETSTVLEAGIRLIPKVGLDLPAVINAQYPARAMQGYVLALGKDFFGGGDYSLVVINLGTRDGVTQGSVLDLREGLRELTDTFNDEVLSIPTVKFGEVLIYKAAEKISLGIITSSSRMVVNNDVVAVIPSDYSGI
jgi:hypothetical protein